MEFLVKSFKEAKSLINEREWRMDHFLSTIPLATAVFKNKDTYFYPYLHDTEGCELVGVYKKRVRKGYKLYGIYKIIN